MTAAPPSSPSSRLAEAERPRLLLGRARLLLHGLREAQLQAKAVALDFCCWSYPSNSSPSLHAMSEWTTQHISTEVSYAQMLEKGLDVCRLGCTTRTELPS